MKKKEKRKVKKRRKDVLLQHEMANFAPSLDDDDNDDDTVKLRDNKTKILRLGNLLHRIKKVVFVLIDGGGVGTEIPSN